MTWLNIFAVTIFFPDKIRSVAFRLPAIVSTSTRMHGEFLRLLFLQAHRETEAHFTAAGMSSQTNNSEALGSKRAAHQEKTVDIFVP